MSYWSPHSGLEGTAIIAAVVPGRFVKQKCNLEVYRFKPCIQDGHLQCTNSPRLSFFFLHYLVCFFFQERGLDVGAQASWLASSFNETAKEFYNKTTEVSRKLALWGPLGSYLEGVAEVFETSTSLRLSEEKLLNEGFDWLLPACRLSELNSALGFLQIVLAQLR